MPNNEDLEKVADNFKKFILEKNKRYGNAALEPIGVFTKHKNENEAVDGILQRLDDKLMRVKNANALRKNDVTDLMGYLMLLCTQLGWNDFEDLID